MEPTTITTITTIIFSPVDRRESLRGRPPLYRAILKNCVVLPR